MYKLLGNLASFLKYHEIVTDCAIFRMHNTFTTALLLACSVIITATQFVGNPIQCIVNGLPNHVVNTYCWISSTFTMPDAFRRQVGTEVAHPGIANDFDDDGAQKYYTYYQWVCFVLFFQAMACYTPKVLWDACENNLMKTLVMGLNIGICPEEEKCQKKEVILGYLMKHVKPMHPLFAINNGPLHYALSQMGRGKADRVHKERIFFKTHAHQPLRTRKRRYPDPRPYRRRGRTDDGIRGMDLLRGVYTLTQQRHH